MPGIPAHPVLFSGGGYTSGLDVPASLAGAPLIFGNACESASLSGGSAAAQRGNHLLIAATRSKSELSLTAFPFFFPTGP